MTAISNGLPGRGRPFKRPDHAKFGGLNDCPVWSGPRALDSRKRPAWPNYER